MYPDKRNLKTAGKRATMFILAASITAMTVSGFPYVFAEAAHAATSPEVRKKNVRYGDLNLATELGREILDRRIRRAAKQVCTETGVPSILQRRQVRACTASAHSKAWASVEDRIDSAKLARDQ